MMKLALGTAQFGSDYGVTNKNGVVPPAEIVEILNYAQANNILTIDTASSYGQAEKKLGDSGVDLSLFQIITKIPPKLSYEEIEERFFQSLNNLQLKKISGLLIHNVNDLLLDGGGKIWKLLKQLKSQGFVDKIGVSIYSEEEIRRVLLEYEIDIIQLPVNVFDQRLLKSGILEEIKSKEIEIHARSLFLQGVLLENTDKLPEYFLPFKEKILKWHSFLKKHGLTPLEGAIAFAHSLNIIDYAIVGIASLNNLMEIKTAFDKVKSLPNMAYEEFAINDRQLVNPSLWKH